LPQNANGKLDRAALPAPQPGPAAEGRVPPRTPLEEVLCGIVAEILEQDEVGVFDSFFDLGGNSLLAVRVMSLIRDTFGVEVAVAHLFESPTVSELAIYLTGEPELRQRIETVMPVLLEMAGDPGREARASCAPTSGSAPRRDGSSGRSSSAAAWTPARRSVRGRTGMAILLSRSPRSGSGSSTSSGLAAPPTTSRPRSGSPARSILRCSPPASPRSSAATPRCAPPSPSLPEPSPASGWLRHLRSLCPG